MVKTFNKTYLKITAVVSCLGILGTVLYAVQNQTESFKSQAPKTDVERRFFTSAKSDLFKPRLQHGPEKKIGGVVYQCWNDNGVNKNELSGISGRFVSQDKILKRIDSIQYACGKTVFGNKEELTQIKTKYRNIVLAKEDMNELDMCESSTLHFLLRDASSQSPMSTSACPI